MNDLLVAESNDRVARGVTWLDENLPGWEHRLFDRVDITSGRLCVLGQLFGSLGLALAVVPDEDGWLADHGFICGEEDFLAEEDFTPAWEAHVYARGARRFLCRPVAPSPTFAADASPQDRRVRLEQADFLPGVQAA